MGALAATGLIYDIAGVLLLGWALLTPNRVDHFILSAPFYNGNPTLFLALRAQKFDASCGLALLVLGFSLQLLSNLGLGTDLWLLPSISIASLIVGFPFLLIWHRHLQRTNAKVFEAAAADYESKEKAL